MSCRAVSDLMYSFSFPKAYVDVGCCYFDQIFLEVVSGVLQCYCWMTVRTEVSPGEVVFVLKSVYEGVSCKAVRVFFFVEESSVEIAVQVWFAAKEIRRVDACSVRW